MTGGGPARRLAASLLATGLLVAACGDEAGQVQEPDQALRAFLEAVQDDDCDAARELAQTPSLVDCDDLASLDLGEGRDPGDAAIEVEEVNGPSALVTLAWDDSEPAELEMQQVGDAWKVVLDSPA